MRWLVVVVFVIGCSDRKEAAPAAEASPWREDLAFLAAELPRRHVEPFFRTPEAEFRAAVAALDAELPRLDDARAIAGLARIVASLGDGHTSVRFPADPAPVALALMWFPEGIFVFGAPRAHPWAVGARVVAIGGTPIDDAIAKVTPLVAHDNASHRRALLPRALTQPLVLAGADVAPLADTITYELELPDGSRRPLALAPGGKAAAAPGEVPLSRRHPQLHYWNDWLADERTVYFQYNVCADDPKQQPFARFAAGMLAFLDQQPVERVIIDLRYNGGGSSEILRPLIEGLVARADGFGPGRLFVVIGRHTFSSAVLNALELDRRTSAILVGEPSGGKPSHHGEVKTMTLPRSGLVVQYSTKFFRAEGHDGDAIEPELRVEPTAAAWFAGGDPALEAIRKQP